MCVCVCVVCVCVCVCGVCVCLLGPRWISNKIQVVEGSFGSMNKCEYPPGNDHISHPSRHC